MYKTYKKLMENNETNWSYDYGTKKIYDEENNEILFSDEDIINANKELKSELSYKSKIIELNSQRAKETSEITIEIDSVSLDGDEESQTRMARAISVLQEGEKIVWIDALGIPQELTKEKLQSFLKEAGKKQTEIFIKYSELKGEL